MPRRPRSRFDIQPRTSASTARKPSNRTPVVRAHAGVFKRLPAAVAVALVLTASAAHAQLPHPPYHYDPQAHYLVTSSYDAADRSVGDGVCRTSGGRCTLRAALQEAAVDHATSTIQFSDKLLGGATIKPASPLPFVRDFAGPTIIDARTSVQAKCALPRVELSGRGATFNGLNITSAGNVVKGLAIHGFKNQVRITGWYNELIGNFIGTDPTSRIGATGPPDPSQAGVLLDGDAAHNIIGREFNPNFPDFGCGSYNVISGNAGPGIAVRGTASGNRISGNLIGLKVGTEIAVGPLPNLGSGVVLGAQTRYNIIGGNGNHIAGNEGHGVELSGTLNRVDGNVLGQRPRTPYESVEEPADTIVPNKRTNVAIGPSTESRILTNTMAGNNGGVTVGVPPVPGVQTAIDGVRVVSNGIGPSDPGNPSAIGVSLFEGTNTTVAGNWIGYQNIGIKTCSTDPGQRLIDNQFEGNARNTGC